MATYNPNWVKYNIPPSLWGANAIANQQTTRQNYSSSNPFSDSALASYYPGGAGASNPNSPNPLGVSPGGRYVVSKPIAGHSGKTTKGGPGMGSGKKAKPKKAPKWADAEYQNQIRHLTRAMSDYRAQMGVKNTRLGTQYSASQRDMRQQGDRDRRQILNDFAARGIVRSGVYGSKRGEYEQEFGNQMADLTRGYTDAKRDVSMDYTNFRREQTLQTEEARLAAIRRRANKLGSL